MTFDDLESEDRLRLMRFVCSFAWADLNVADSEKAMVEKLADELKLTSEENSQVASWLAHPPPIDDVDPTDIPRQHREIFLTVILRVIGADGVFDPNEMESLSLFEQLLR